MSAWWLISAFLVVALIGIRFHRASKPAPPERGSNTEQVGDPTGFWHVGD